MKKPTSPSLAPADIQAPLVEQMGTSDDPSSSTKEPNPADSSSVSQSLRIVHYLGSKSRLLAPIRETIADIVPAGGRVCDLFAGSGTVAHGLCSEWDVVTVDIQEYSRVICSALLNPSPSTLSAGKKVLESARRIALRKKLRSSLVNLLSYEKNCLQNAATGRVDPLCDLLEYGSLEVHAFEGHTPVASLSTAIQCSLDQLSDQGLASGPQSVVTRHFGGVFFSWEQAIDLDALLDRIHRVPEPVRDSLLSAALAVASEIVNTVGKQFAQPIKPRDTKGIPKRHLIRQILRDRSMSVFDRFESWLHKLSSVVSSHRHHQTIRADYQRVLENRNLRFDAIYADPPYTRDHYSRFYHVLETMALHDEPNISTTKIHSGNKLKLSRGMYRADRHQSPFCIKSKAPDAFSVLFDEVARRGIPLILSYSPYSASGGNRPRLLTTEELQTLASQYFNNVNLRSLDGIAHNKFNLTRHNKSVDYDAEILLICLP